MADPSGKIQTVLGEIDPTSLGRTLTHEHLSLFFGVAFTPSSPKADFQDHVNCAFNLDNLGWIRQFPYSHKPNLKFNDDATHLAVEKELDYFRSNGGSTIVENTTHGLQRNVALLQQLSQKTGVNIIAGTGYYVAASQPESTMSQTNEQLYQLMVQEVTDGCIDYPQVKCGLIGEIGCSWPLDAFERKVIQATAEAQKATGCPVSFHPGRNHQSPFEIIRLFQEAGGDVSKTIMSHLERTIFDASELLEFSQLGTYCQLDLFGIECSHYQLDEKIDMPSDAQRIQTVKKLIDEGCDDRILLSHDIHTKHRLMKFGGHGLSHIYLNVLPKMIQRGISSEMIDKITIDNPKCCLTFKQQ